MPPAIDKRALLATIKDQLARELERSTERARDAADAATHEENRAEGDKDMRATEASYVARGHTERVHQLEQALAKLGALSVRDFGPDDTIASSALVELESGDRRALYFLLPAAGGERLQFQGVSLQTIATTSPLGAALLGLSEGDEAEVTTPQGTRSYLITGVQ
ncbi:GreA/GreB family elongation factor [Sorangium sp. So ce131]|uniref:GreA/GreB family elongation factor n=1 Tax=Sorangium sp. So ce131 TaxID=3133282 RepID=UPI003F61E58C